MKLLGRIFIILFLALAVVGVTVSVTDTSASNNNYRDRSFTAENNPQNESDSTNNASPTLRPERDNHHHDSFNLFGAVSILGTIAKIGLITLIVHTIGRFLKKKPGEKSSAEKTPEPENPEKTAFSG